jgi:hypothetical protein
MVDLGNCVLKRVTARLNHVYMSSNKCPNAPGTSNVRLWVIRRQCAYECARFNAGVEVVDPGRCVLKYSAI